MDSISQNSAIGARGKTSQTSKGVRQARSRRDRLRFALLALLAALLLFASIRGIGLAGYDDAVYAHEGKEMLRTGDWRNIRYNGHLNFEYPPLFIWLEAGSFKIFGVNDEAAKLPSALAGLGTIVVVYFLTLELTGVAWLALLGMFVLASTQFFVKNAGRSMTDVPFTFFFVLAIFFYVKGWKGFYVRGWKSPAYLALAGVAAGLAQLTRPVVGLVALGIIVAHAILSRRRRWLFGGWMVAALALALALPLLWYLEQYRLHGSEALASLLVYLGRKVQASPGGSWRTVLNYPKSLLEYYWPWLPFLLAGLWMEIRTAARRDEAARLLLLWVILVSLPLVLVQNRYPRYMLPLYPAFAIVSAMAVVRIIPAARRKLVFNCACAAACLAVFFAFLFPPKTRGNDIRSLVPVAEAASAPDQRVVVYSREDLTPDAASEPARSEYLNDFLWYSNRYAELAPDVDELAAIVNGGQNAVFIVDKDSYEKLRQEISAEVASRLKVLGQAGNFVCFEVM